MRRDEWGSEFYQLKNNRHNMKNRILIGLGCGLVAGILDMIPMIVQSLPWDANLSALSMWIVSGFFISKTELKMNAILKGILISYLCLAPSAFLIGSEEPVSLFPILVMTTFLGGVLGYGISYLIERLKV